MSWKNDEAGPAFSKEESKGSDKAHKQFANAYRSGVLRALKESGYSGADKDLVVESVLGTLFKQYGEDQSAVTPEVIDQAVAERAKEVG